MKTTTDSARRLPDFWQHAVEAELAADERLIAWFQPDLDEALHFAASLVVLTDQRLIWWGPQQTADRSPRRLVAGQRNLAGQLTMECREVGRVGTLSLVDRAGLIVRWHFTPGQSTPAHRLVQRFELVRRGELDRALAEAICPSCGAIISSDDGLCPACHPTAAPPPVGSLFRLIQFARPHAKAVAAGFVLTLAGTAAGLVPPYLTMPLLDRVLIPHQSGLPVDQTLVIWYLGGLVGAALLAWTLAWGRTYTLSWVSERVAADLRSHTYAHLQRLSLEFFGGKRTGDLMARVGTDTDRICNFLSLNLVSFATDVVMIMMTAAVLLWINPLLAVVTLAPFPLIVWIVYRVRSRLRVGFRQSSIAWGELTSVLADTIPGIRVVKAFAQEAREIDRFRRANQKVLSANDRVNVVWSFFGPIITLLTEVGLLVVWAFGAWLVFRNGITVGMLTAFLAYISRFYARTESLIRMVGATQRAAASAHRVFEILDRVPSVAEPVRPVHPGRLRGSVELRGVRFRYGTREVLHGIDLSIEPGEMIGLVGPSGAGKSTLINLVCRFYDVTEGAILVDGVDIRSFAIEEYRRNIGIVLQEPFLFYGTVAENIAYGKPDAAHADIVAAARAARAHEFILRLPDGYDSLVGERGQSLSGGERQRISIARALLIDPRILILDEATSSVDTETEVEIQAALENLIQGRTTIAIAHRLSTLRRADRLVVLEHGRIVEIGKHEELLDAPGVYARLHRAQMELANGAAAWPTTPAST